MRIGKRNRPQRFAFFLLMALVPLLALSFGAKGQEAERTAYMIEVDGAIGPASAAYVTDALHTAREENAALIILRMDTPGGLDSSMREIIRSILAMPVPVVGYVHPSGARAASAGTYILYASHVAAMTPGTNLGAAMPVQMGGSPGPTGDAEGQQDAPQDAHERKAVNDAVAYIRSLAELRGRNADWAEAAVREAASLSAEAALRDDVIDIVAADIPSLLRQLDGRRFEIDGNAMTLNTEGLTVKPIEPDWADKLLATITDPNIAMILMMVGIYGIFFEFMNPGSFVPGTVGGISLLIWLYALAALPLDIAGLALILLGIALMISEAFVPSFGILGLGGLAAFIFGSTMLFDTDIPAFQVQWSVIAALAVFSAGLIAIVVRLAVKSHKRRIETGREELVGAKGEVIDWADGAGHVFVHSERWSAVGPASMAEGSPVIVDRISGLKLEVSPTEETLANRIGANSMGE